MRGKGVKHVVSGVCVWLITQGTSTSIVSKFEEKKTVWCVKDGRRHGWCRKDGRDSLIFLPQYAVITLFTQMIFVVIFSGARALCWKMWTFCIPLRKSVFFPFTYVSCRFMIILSIYLKMYIWEFCFENKHWKMKCVCVWNVFYTIANLLNSGVNISKALFNDTRSRSS